MSAGQATDIASRRPTRQRGFTLIELMIAVAVIAILASIAYPSYQRYVQQARVTDGQSGLMQAASEMERCYTVSSTYPDDCLVTTSSPDGVYPNITLTESGSTFRLEATGATRVTDGCSTLWIRSNGERGAGEGENRTTGSCW
ncbi:hypothetical protein BWR19_17330 [Halomonas sp. 1513]|nr:type IV pilin protein [Halomonas sp. 1513]APX94546.1 hypothetical protein BWR19_17330 [Halomonas sp. 1513]